MNDPHLPRAGFVRHHQGIGWVAHRQRTVRPVPRLGCLCIIALIAAFWAAVISLF